MIFANIMQYKSTLKKYWEKVLRRYRFVIMTDSSFEEKLVLKISRLNILGFLAISTIGFCFIILLLLAYTPLNEYVPGKAKKEDTFAFHYRPDYRMAQVQFPQQMRATPTVSATYEPTTGWSSYQANNTQVTLYRAQGEDSSNTYVRALKLDSEL